MRAATFPARKPTKRAASRCADMPAVDLAILALPDEETLLQARGVCAAGNCLPHWTKADLGQLSNMCAGLRRLWRMTWARKPASP